MVFAVLGCRGTDEQREITAALDYLVSKCLDYQILGARPPMMYTVQEVACQECINAVTLNAFKAAQLPNFRECRSDYEEFLVPACCKKLTNEGTPSAQIGVCRTIIGAMKDGLISKKVRDKKVQEFLERMGEQEPVTPSE